MRRAIQASFAVAFAWLGHLRLQGTAVRSGAVLLLAARPSEYAPNVSAIRYGHVVFTGGEMAAMNL